jgi:Flp pilus assembly protein TadG
MPIPQSHRRRRQLGATALEASLTLTLFLLTIFTLFDLGYVMYVHQTLAERARAAARYGSLNPTDSTGMKNIAIYYQTTGSGAGVLGLTTANVTAVRSGVGTTADRVTVTIQNYPFMAVWPGRSQTGLPIIVTMPVENN